MAAAMLTASPAQIEALWAKELGEIARTLRRRVDNHPGRYGGCDAKLDAAERSIQDKRLLNARDQITAVTRLMEERDASVGVKEALAEQEKLGDLRGAPTHQADAGNLTRDGWLWLKAKGRFDTTRRAAGDHFREKFNKATDSLRSCTGDQTGGGGEGPSAIYSNAKFELDGVKLHMRRAAGEDTGRALFNLLSAVCGQGATVRQIAKGEETTAKIDRRSDALVIELGLALDMAGVYFGMIRA